MKTLFQKLAPLLFLAVCSCEPKERFQWSPDGSRAALILEYHLFLADEDGVLTAELAKPEEEPNGKVLTESFDWLPDGTGLITHQIRIVHDWNDARSLVSKSEANRVESLSARIPELLIAATTLHGDADQAELLLARLAPGESEMLGNALRLAFLNEPEKIVASLGPAPRALASLENRSPEERGFILHELALVSFGSGPGDAEVRVISREIRGIKSLRVSPHYPVFACARTTAETSEFDLETRGFDGSLQIEVAAGISSAYDWTPDGRSLVFAAPLTRESRTLMKIQRCTVLGKDGSAPDSSVPVAQKNLALAIIPFAPRIATLPDGSILFAAQPGTLPIGGDGATPSPRLYRLPPDGGIPEAIPADEGVLPMDLGYFVPSPDGRRVAVVESGTDAVAVLHLASGESTLLSPPHPDFKCRTLPAWRNSNELTYAAPDPHSARISWLLWNDRDKTKKDLSESWPPDATKGWLEKKESTSPAGQTP